VSESGGSKKRIKHCVCDGPKCSTYQKPKKGKVQVRKEKNPFMKLFGSPSF
jgi:hypothetical protein